MRGQAALAMWWDIAPQLREEFEHWHSHEHFPERLALPGFRRASRWGDAGGGDGFFVLYELDTYEALVSPEYLARLNAPSEWSQRMMPHHRHMVRSPSRVLISRGAAVAGNALTLRFSPAPGSEEPLRKYVRSLVQGLPRLPGIAGAHLLQTEMPAIAPTTEQRIRGLADRAADWILIVLEYEPQSLRAALQGELSPAALHAAGAAGPMATGVHVLRLAMNADEVD
jgi:hypothetical protein